MPFEFYSITCEEARRPDQLTASFAYHYCKLVMSHLGMFSWEQRSVMLLLCVCLSVRLCLHAWVCVYLCVCVCVCVCMCMCAHVMCMCAHVVCAYVCACIVCICTYVHACVCVCMCIVNVVKYHIIINVMF